MAIELIGDDAVKRQREKPRRHCARCGSFDRHGDDHLRVQMHGATNLFHWRCFLAQMRESGPHNNTSSIRQQ